MNLSESTLRELEFGTLLKHLAEHTVSPLGRERALQLGPLMEREVIEERLSEATEMRAVLDYDDPLPLGHIEDTRKALEKAAVEESMLSPQEVVAIGRIMACARRMRSYFAQRREKYPHLEKIVRQLEVYPALEKRIEHAIDCATYEVKDQASEDLAAIRREILQTQERVRRRLESILRSLADQDILQEEVITLREGALVLMVKAERRHEVRGMILDYSSSGATAFMEPLETLELNNRIRELIAEERREIERILRELTALIRAERIGIDTDLELLGQLDLIYAKARLSRDYEGAAPRVTDQPSVTLVDARHPLLLLKKGGSKSEVVPLDLTLGEAPLSTENRQGRQGEACRTLVITGPNAGGKTVALKTVGLLTLMTQCGLHIPASPESEMGIFEGIFTDIGDQQSLEQDLSTFSAHMARVREILEKATPRSLVLIDEIGAGTDPEEGAALAMAILEELTARRSVTLVTTHQGALKAFAAETPGVENGSMEFDTATLRPTYRFRLGLPGSSYALEIARRWGIPEEVIQRSRARVGEEKSKLEKLLVDLEERMQRYDRLLREAHLKESQLEGLMKLYRERTEVLQAQERHFKRKALEESEEILRRANALVEQAIREIRESQASKEAIKRAKTSIETEKRQVQKELASPAYSETGPPMLEEIHVGDRVRWRGHGAEGVVLKELDSSGRVLLEAGGLKLRVPAKELEKIPSSEAAPPRVSSVRYKPKSDVRPELHIRGLTVDEALTEVDKFLDDAYLAGLGQVRIVHGKGTGALRKSIGEFLEEHPRVKAHHPAAWNEGGIGVTVVELEE